MISFKGDLVVHGVQVVPDISSISSVFDEIEHMLVVKDNETADRSIVLIP